MRAKSKSKILHQIVGKTISGFIFREGNGAGPWYQLFIVFSDNTYLEFYGDLSWNNSLEAGDLEAARQYAASFKGMVEEIS